MSKNLVTHCVYCGREFNKDGECEHGCYDRFKCGMPENAYNQLSDRDNFIEIFLSLSKSLQTAGGPVKRLDELKKMSAYDLICLLAPNKIRFYNASDN